MKNLLSRVLIAALTAVILVAPVVLADTFPTGGGPGNSPPQIYMINSSYNLCGDGASRPDGFDAQVNGCVDVFWNREDEYAFTGEQIEWYVVVRDLNGALDILTAHGTIDGLAEVKCNDVSNERDFTGEFTDQLPQKLTAPAGFNYTFDKVFHCLITVEPSWSGESVVNIEAFDQAGSVSTDSISQTWFFNPAVLIDLSTNNGASSISYETGLPGQTVGSTNKLVITNLADGGVHLYPFIGASDLTDPTHTAVKCPLSNVLNTDGSKLYEGLEYRCKIGSSEDDTWHNIDNKDNSQSCSTEGCLGLDELLPGFPPWDNDLPPLGTAECQFRLTYPVPCVGSFTEGVIYVAVRAI